MLREGKLTDEARRRIERELDLREADVLNRRKRAAGLRVESIPDAREARDRESEPN